MRRGLFLFLIVLVALRGLTGPAMAASMVLPGSASHPIVAAASPHAHDHRDDASNALAADAPLHAAMDHSATPACHGDAAAAHGTAASDCGDAGSHGPHSACADCDICHTAVFAPPALTAAPRVSATADPAPGATPFASAAPSRAIKPPIS